MEDKQRVDEMARKWIEMGGDADGFVNWTKEIWYRILELKEEGDF